MSNIDYHDPVAIRTMGIDALTKALGPIGMVYFLRQFDRGYGDYTKERQEWFQDETLDSLCEQLKNK